SYAIKSLIKEFNKKNPDINVRVTLGGSGKLVAQILHGAPYDLFMSANMKYPQALYKKSLAITEPIVYAQGSLAYLSSQKHNFSDIYSLLNSNAIKKIAIASPKTAPYGAASVEAFKKAGLYEELKKKLVYGESISQTLSYTLSAVDMGLIAKSALYSPKLAYLKEGVNWSSVDTKLYTPIKQGVVILKRAQNNRAVENFYTFVLSDTGRKILKDFGYIVP
ncbi:MAG: molybdate ABC transporter substrate-binding protein, partial [Campylobacterota bacterium]|nr:molybdate ABC transporter substrate-binding protein [Campylobacterota bacterium]